MAHSQLTVTVTLLVICSGALHATWNAIAKHVEDQLMAFALIGASVTVIAAITLAITGLPARAAVGFAMASAVIHVGYELGLMNSYRLGAFNQTYPIARGTSPLVVAVGAYLFAGERLTGVPLAGVVILAAGLMGLAASAGRLTPREAPAVAAALATGLTIAGYSLVDGLGVRHAGNPYAYIGLLFVLQGPVFPVVALIRRPASRWRRARGAVPGLMAGALSVLAYGIVLWAQTRAPLAEVAAIRETSVVFAAIIGMVFLRERFGLRRMAAAAMIVTGVVLISA